MNDIASFITLMEEFGFDLIAFWAHSFKHDECGTGSLTMSKTLRKGYYGVCYFGSEFFEFLLTESLTMIRETQTIRPNRIYIGAVYLKTEEHHFTLIAGNKYVRVLNTYGGHDTLYIDTLSISDFNSLMHLTDNTDTFERVFGFTPLKEGKYIEHMLEEYPLILPSQSVIKHKMDLIQEGLSRIEDTIDFIDLKIKITQSI